MIKVLIGDDHAVLRRGLKQIIQDTGDFSVACEASSGQEVLDKVEEGGIDLVLLDISMPGMDGIDVLKQIKSRHPKIPVLMLSMYPEEHYAVRALKAGASGYLTKNSAPEELISALRKVSSGKKYVSISLAEKLASEIDIISEKPLHESLSDREYQVLCMIASGKTVKEISDKLSLSIKTVSTYRSRIIEKMNLKSNAELTRYAIKNNLID